MTEVVAVIAGGGPSGLYTAWRLLNDPKSTVTQVHILEMSAERFGGRIHTQTFKNGDYVDLGGMRFADDQRLINKMASELHFLDSVTDFVESDNRLFYLRGKHIYSDDIASKKASAPYNTPYNNVVVDEVFNALAAATAGSSQKTRKEWCEWIETAKLSKKFPSDVYNAGAKISNIGFWNLLLDYVGSEAFQYAADAGGYTSNIINWNAADAIPYNGEFGLTVKYKRFKGGYTKFIDALAEAVQQGGRGTIHLGQRLTSFDESGNKIDVTYEDTNGTGTAKTITADYLFMAMPRRSVELVAQSAYKNTLAKQLANSKVKLYLESVIEQPSYKIGISFNSKWWDNCTYKPQLNKPANAWGPTITDLPLRQIYYFTPEQQAKGKNYAMIASYDDIRFTNFWQQLELSTEETRSVPLSENFQPLQNGAPLNENMKKMVAVQLAQVHYSSAAQSSGYQQILNAMTEAYYMDWSLNPFGAGYHAWAAHYKICDVMQKVRRPLALTGSNANVFLVGSAYSNDQAWVEGAFCTAESVLVDKNMPFKFDSLIDLTDYPLICKCTT